jgi:hypothetical protein
MPEIRTSAELKAAFRRADDKVRNAIVTGVERLLNFTASKAQKNVRMKKKGGALGAGASLVQSIGVGQMGIRYVNKTTGYITGRVGTALKSKDGKPYPAYLEFGTGIYGPKRRRITPKHAKVLAWKSTTGFETVPGVSATGKATRHRQRTSNMHFAASVKGIPPWHWLSDALEEMKSKTLGTLVNAAREVGL